MLVSNRFGHERYCQNDDTGDGEQDDGEIEVVNATYDGGTVTRGSTGPRSISKLSDHPAQANKQSNNEAIKGTLRN